MQSETRIDGPHGAVGVVTPRWFMGSLRGWWVVTPDPQPTISGARTESEPPLCPCGARTFGDGSGRKCLNCGLRQRALAWATDRYGPAYREPAYSGYLAGARAEVGREVTVRTGTLMGSNTADGGGRVG